MSLQSKVVMLEKKVNLLTKAMDILLLEGETTSKGEARIIRSRLRDYLQGRKSKFIEFKHVA